VRQPPKWLRAFRKLTVATGKSRVATFRLDERAFSYWDVRRHAWRVAPGCYGILVGASAADIRVRTKVRIAGGRLRGAC
jgi:beta-glucosidase